MARGKGEGTISLQKNGLYCGRLTIGYDADGKQKRKAIYGKTKREVLEKMDQVKVAISNKEYFEPSKMDLCEWLDMWLVDYKKRSVRHSTYYSNYHYPANHSIKPAFVGTKLKDLTSGDVQHFVNELHDNGMKRGSICNIIECLSAALKQAVENDMIPSNVTENIVLPREDDEEIRVLTATEQKRFITVAERYPYGDLYIFILGTGARLGEAMALTWGDIDFDNAVVSISKTLSLYYNMDDRKVFRELNPTKTHSGNRVIPLLPSVSERLKVLKAITITTADGDPVFSDDGKMPTESTIRRRLKRLLKKVNIDPDGIHVHTLRHTFATRGLENGVELVVMKELLGHSSIRMTADTYTHLLDEKKADSIMKLADTIIL